MRILIVVDNQLLTEPALKVGATLGANLWAHVNLLTVVSGNDRPDCAPDDLAKSTLVNARKTLIGLCGPDGPYSMPVIKEEAVTVRPGLFDYRPVVDAGKKELKLRARYGEPGREIIDEAYEEDADLIIMSASNSDSSSDQQMPAPLQVATEASCSTLIIKDLAQVQNIIVGLETPKLNQSAREMFNQIANIFKAPAAMYPLPSIRSAKDEFSEAMEKLVKIFKVHDLNVITADATSADRTIAELYDQAQHNMLILR